MPSKRRTGKRKMKGKGFFGDIGNAFKKAGEFAFNNVIKPVAGKVVSNVKPSTLLALHPATRAVSAPLAVMGMGKRKGRKHQRGRGVAGGMYHPDIVGASVMSF